MPATIFSIYNQKGGSCKTTTSMQVAGTLGRRGRRVLLVDLDKQSTATRWASLAPDNRPFPAQVMNLSAMEGKAYREIQRFMNEFDHIIIDCIPGLDDGSSAESRVRAEINKSAMQISDFTLIPVIPTPLDLWATQGTKQLALAARSLNTTLLLRTAAVRVPRNSIAADMISLLREDTEIPLLKSQIGDRLAFQECQLLGGTVHEAKSRGAAAIVEVESLVDEMLALLGEEV